MKQERERERRGNNNKFPLLKTLTQKMHTHMAKGINTFIHTTHLLKTSESLSKNTKIPSNKIYLQISENMN